MSNVRMGQQAIWIFISIVKNRACKESLHCCKVCLHFSWYSYRILLDVNDFTVWHGCCIGFAAIGLSLCESSKNPKLRWFPPSSTSSGWPPPSPPSTSSSCRYTTTSPTTRLSRTAIGSMFLRHKSPDPVVIRLICVAP